VKLRKGGHSYILDKRIEKKTCQRYMRKRVETETQSEEELETKRETEGREERIKQRRAEEEERISQRASLRKHNQKELAKRRKFISDPSGFVDDFMVEWRQRQNALVIYERLIEGTAQAGGSGRCRYQRGQAPNTQQNMGKFKCERHPDMTRVTGSDQLGNISDINYVRNRCRMNSGHIIEGGEAELREHERTCKEYEESKQKYWICIVCFKSIDNTKKAFVQHIHDVHLHDIKQGLYQMGVPWPNFNAGEYSEMTRLWVTVTHTRSRRCCTAARVSRERDLQARLFARDQYREGMGAGTVRTMDMATMEGEK
jgi:hypothetical protein